MSKVHIGKKIKEVWKESRLKGTEFADLINRDRQVIYDIFKRESIDTDLLKHISKVLKHDFFAYYSNDLPLVIEPKTGYEYVTKEEFENLEWTVEKLIKKIDDRFPEKVKADKYKSSKKKGKK